MSSASPRILSSSNFIHVTQNLNRLLYPNPVCLLTTFTSSQEENYENSSNGVTNTNNNTNPSPNVMTITWLTPINTKNQFILSINKKRFSAERMRHKDALFGLQVPMNSWRGKILDIGSFCGKHFEKKAEGMYYKLNKHGIIETHTEDENEWNQWKEEKLQDDAITFCSASKLLSRGYSSILQQFGRNHLKNPNHILYSLYESKFQMLQLDTTHHFDSYSKKKYRRYFPMHHNPSKVPFIEGTCAHLVCGILNVDHEAESDHLLVRAEILDAMVHPEYWKNGKLFFPCKEDPYLTFLGSQEFASVVKGSAE